MFQFLFQIVINSLKTFHFSPNILGDNSGANNRANHKKYMYHHIPLLRAVRPFFKISLTRESWVAP